MPPAKDMQKGPKVPIFEVPTADSPASAPTVLRLAGNPKTFAAGARVRFVTTKGGTFAVPGATIKCDKNGFEFRVDEKQIALQQKMLEQNLKTAAADRTVAFVEIHPEDFAQFKNLADDDKLSRDEKKAALGEAFKTWQSAKRMAISTAQNSVQSMSTETTPNLDSGE